MENFLSSFEQAVSNFLKGTHGLPIPFLILLSFGGGLAASLTPCVLAMLPMNLSYIGTANITSKFDALKKSLFFVLGAALIFSLLGLFASFASFIMIEYRGYVHVIIGIFVLLMALSEFEIVKLPLPQFVTHIPHGGPFIVGMAFALASSPCASPILFAILAMASTTGSILGGTLIMIAYSIGYTGVIFITSLFAGIAKQLGYFKKHSKVISVVSATVLGIIGVFYLYSGIKWFMG